jgi:outer membrane protein assembly factor BamE (lipoprotein component of BamABCDE complex)
MKKPRSAPLTSAGLALALGLAACTPTIELRGNLPPPEQLSQIVVGKSTRDDVQMLLGTPSNISPFGEEAWHYVSTVTERVAFFEPETKERKVVSVLFSRDGVVRAVETKGLSDGHNVTPVARETPTAGKEMTIVQQLLGNLGRFSKPAQGQ